LRGEPLQGSAVWALG